jgi:hypothetical protein
MQLNWRADTPTSAMLVLRFMKPSRRGSSADGAGVRPCPVVAQYCPWDVRVVRPDGGKR